MVSFDLAVDYVFGNEGVLEESASDPGGITKYGISLRFLLNVADLRKYGFSPGTINGDTIRELTIAQAKALYKGEFWDHAPFQTINNQQNANFIFDMAVNMGISPAIKCAQRACCAVMKRRAALVDDGVLGNGTIEMINHCGPYLLPAMRSERAGEYRMIAVINPGEKDELEGWLTRSYGS